MITAVFTDNSDYARATGLWQWDYGQRLRIEGLKLPTAVEIHFALTEQSGDAITRVGTTKDGVTEVVIPDSLLENQAAGATYEIYAWIYLADKTSGETIKRISMQVKCRPKPEGHDTPEDAELFREAIEAVNASADRAETAREGAETAQRAAEEAANKIEGEIAGSEELAKQVKQDADAVARDKQAVAQMVTETTQNAQKATEAAQAAERSSTAAKEAQTAAESAKAGATAAMEEVERDRTEVSEIHRAVEQLREAVDTDRQAVAADRRAVENTALQFGQAAQSAINAVGQAQDAAVGAVSAEGQRQTTAVQQAGTQAVSDVTAAKTEAVQAVTTEGDTQTKRVQDAAAGIVADREQIAANKQAIEGKVDKQQGADNAGKALVVGADGNVELGDAQTKTDPTLTESGQAADAQVAGREIATLHQGKADAIVETARGETMTLTDSSDKLFEGLRVFGKSTQDGTPSVENPVPIVSAGESGSIKVEVTGRNLIDYTKAKGDADVQFIDGGFIVGGDDRHRIVNVPYEFKKGESYTVTYKNKILLGSKNINVYLPGGKYSISGSASSQYGLTGNKPFIPQDEYTAIGFYIDKDVATNSKNEITDLCLVKTGTDITYEPYRKPQSLAISTPNGLPGVPVTKDGNYTDKDGQQWVCDEIDLERGKYVQRVGKYVFSGTEAASDTWLPTIIVNMRTDGLTGKHGTGQLMSNYAAINFSNTTGRAFGFATTKWNVNNAEELKLFLKNKSDSGSPVIVQYVLATPIERDLTPEELAAYSSLHTNYPTTVITNDAGAHMEASYVADTGTYIRNMESRLNAKLVNIQSALISQKISGGGIKVTDSSRVPVVRFAMWGKTEQVRTSGKNLIDIPEIKAETGNIEVIRNITRNAVFSCRKEDVVITKSIWRVQFKYKNGNSVYLTDENISPGTIKVTEDNPIVSIVYRGMYIESGRYTDIQLEYGSSATTYEPYSGGFPSPSPDYPQPIEITDQPVTVTVKGGTEQQSITLSPPKPMTKWDKLEKVDGVWCWVYQHNTAMLEDVNYNINSNYEKDGIVFSHTFEDASGGNQTSLCTRLINQDYIYGPNHKDKVGYCDHITLGTKYFRLPNREITTVSQFKEWLKVNPTELVYKTKECESIPLSPSEQDKLNALTMYAPETEVTNTGGCNMELTYTVDTKSYVDNKIAAISAAVLEV